jgi:cell division protein FtsX
MMSLRSVHALGHVVGRGLRGMLQAPLVQFQAIATIAICMLLLAVVCLGWANARHVVTGWGVDVPMAVYLVDDVPDVDAEDLRERLLERPEVARAERVSPGVAMERLARGLGENADWLEGIEPEILPETIEVHLRADAEPGAAEDLAAWLATLALVDEVAIAGAWVGQVEALLDTLRRIVLGVACGVAFACLAIVWTTIRLAVSSRRTEIEILRLVGGTPRFVRGPFLVEGLIQGATGAGLALGILHLGWGVLEPHLARGLSLVFAAGSLRFFAPVEIAVGIGFGASVGLLGSRAAVARYSKG